MLQVSFRIVSYYSYSGYFSLLIDLMHNDVTRLDAREE
jgi:hypothetical protein